MDLNLRGKTILITGASKGIGLGIAECFAAEGSNLMLVARSEALLGDVATKLRDQYQVEVQTLAVDLSSEESREVVMSTWPDVDILINNAGDVPGGSIQDVDDAAWRRGWDLKVFGYLSLTRFYLSRMKERTSGVIINIIGAAGERPLAQYIAGSMGNVGLMGMTVALGAESPDYGVRVVGVNPGPVATERIIKLTKGWAETKLGDPERYAELLATSPFGRAATVDEIAASVVFLASDRSSYTSGTILTIDGGWANRPNS